MQRVLEYIDAHFDDDFRLEVLSGIAAFSKYHFHRQFSELFGIIGSGEVAERTIAVSQPLRATRRTPRTPAAASVKQPSRKRINARILAAEWT